ncbi:TniB family NTP-binding protein [Neorhizobium sp. 2083]|uniref:TniB family NTP-binding protein n=1 Tax=Neorhizobium sp. 2083 TaxID=2817762 RepID=UPI0038621A5F
MSDIPHEQRRMLNLLRFLGNELRILLICLVSHAARDAMRGDAPLNSRCEPYGLPPWRHDADPWIGRRPSAFVAIALAVPFHGQPS